MKVFAKGGEFELDPALVRSLVATYPGINVRRELERMYLWTLKNPAKRWELPLRGIESWLRRESRKAQERRAAEKTPAKALSYEYATAATTKPVVNAWWTSEDGIIRRGRELGLEPRRGETMANFKTRVNESDKMSRATRAA